MYVLMISLKIILATVSTFITVSTKDVNDGHILFLQFGQLTTEKNKDNIFSLHINLSRVEEERL